MVNYLNKYWSDRVPYLPIIGLVFIGFMLLIPNASAETMKLLYNSDTCFYKPKLDLDYCYSTYEICDLSLIDVEKSTFLFKEERGQYSSDINTISSKDISIVDKGFCKELTISAYKSPFKNVDNVLCTSKQCYYEYAWWNSSFTFKYPVNASTSSGTVTMATLLNDTAITINGSDQYIWCNYTVNTVRSVDGYFYFTNETFYRCVDPTETFSVATIVDQGNGTTFGQTELNLMSWLNMDCTGTNCPDLSRYGNNGTAINTPTEIAGMIGRGQHLTAGNSEYINMTFVDHPSSFTINAWIRLSGTVEGGIVAWGNTGGTNFAQFYNVGATRTIQYGEFDGTYQSITTTDDHLPNEWFMITLVKNGATSTLFINGVENASGTVNKPPTVNTFAIGALIDATPGLFFDDDIDNFMMWNRTLSGDEITALYDNQVGTNDYAPLGDVIELVINTSLLAINTDLDDFVLSDSDFVDTQILNFNTTAANTTFLVLSSMNIEKISGGGTNVISVRVILDSNDTVLEEDLRSVTGVSTIGSSGTAPFVFSVSSGQHNITYQFKRSGNGNINITNFDFNLIQFITTEENSVRSQLILTDFNHTSTTFVAAFNWTMNKIINSSTFIIVKNTLTKTGAGSTTATYFFDNLQSSPFWRRFISSSTDVGSVSGIFIDSMELGIHNHSLRANQTDAGDVVLVNGSLVDFDLSDSSGFIITFFQESNASTNLTDSITLNAGTHLLVETTTINAVGNGYFVSFFSSFSSTTGSQTPRYFIDSPNLTTDRCFTEKRRTLSDNDDIGEAFAYTICDNLTVDNIYTFRLWVEVGAGESLTQLDENLLGLEITNFSITEGELAPIATEIINPANGSNVTGDDVINWIPFFDPNEDPITYNVSLFNLDGSANTSLGITASTSLVLNWDSFQQGVYFLVVEGCDPGGLCDDTNNTISIVSPPLPDLIPSILFCEDSNVLRLQENERTITNGDVTDEITITRTTCQYGCSNVTLSNWGNPGCIESDLTISVFILIFVIIAAFLIWVVQR